MQDQITPLILTYNEAPNIRRTLERLHWAKRIVVVDSFSTDQTLDILKTFPQVDVIPRRFDTHSGQWNHGLDQCDTDWVLALDADYVLTDEFITELQSLRPVAGAVAFFAQFQYCVYGRPLRSTIYPPRAVLFQKRRCHYEQDGHTQRLRTDGNISWLRGLIDHDDRKPLAHWLWAQNRYADLETVKLASTPFRQLSLQDRVRRCAVLAPALVFFYTLFGKALILDGWPGWFYVFQRTVAEMILSLRLIETKLVRHTEAAVAESQPAPKMTAPDSPLIRMPGEGTRPTGRGPGPL